MYICVCMYMCIYKVIKNIYIYIYNKRIKNQNLAGDRRMGFDSQNFLFT